MFRTIPSARLPCCTIFSRLPRNVSVISPISVRSLPSRDAPRSASCSSLVSSAETAEKLLTKLSGFLISCAIPAVSWPSDAIFSAWIRLACAAFSSRSLVRRRLAPGQRLLLDLSHDLVDLVIDIEDAASRLRQQRVALGTVVARKSLARTTRQIGQGIDLASDGGDALGMDGGNLLQILIKTHLGSGGIFLGAGELGDGQIGQPVLQIAEVLARRGGGTDNGDQSRLFGKALRAAHQLSYQQRGRHPEDHNPHDRDEHQPCADRYIPH